MDRRRSHGTVLLPLASLVVGFAAQGNVWRVLGVARRRGQEVASALVPGLGTALALLVAFGGLAFNVGNIAGGGLGLAVLGVPPRAGALLTAVFCIVLLARPTAGRAMDRTTQLLGALMILLTLWVMLASGPTTAAPCGRRCSRAGWSSCRS